MGLLKVHYLSDENITSSLASFRLRVLAIMNVLKEDSDDFLFSVGFAPPRDVDIIVYGKHFNGLSDTLILQTYPYAKHVLDICDDYLSHPKFFSWYNFMAYKASMIVCCSEWIKTRVLQTTNVQCPVVVVKDLSSTNTPMEPSNNYTDKLVAFGRAGNLLGSLKELQFFGKDLTIVSDIVPDVVREIEIHNKYRPWSRDFSTQGFNVCLIPLKDSYNPSQEPHPFGKSENRAVDALMSGCWVVTDNQVVYESLRPFIWVGDLQKGVEYAKNNWDEVKEKIKNAQEYIRQNHSHEVIASQWVGVFEQALRKTKPWFRE